MCLGNCTEGFAQKCFIVLVMSFDILFHRVKVCWKKECWCDEVFARGMEMVLGLTDLLLYGMVLEVIGASGN